MNKTYSLLLMSLLLIASCNKKEEVKKEIWSKEDQYTFDYSARIDIGKDDDFVILNFADQQISSLYSLSNKSIIRKTMEKLIEEIQPDLITCTGDLSCSSGMNGEFFRLFVSFFDEYQIPWAPVYGNHDRKGGVTMDILSETLENSEYCLFKKGPDNVYGQGNYSINVFKDNELFQTIVLLDSGDYDNPNCVITEDDYHYDNRLDIFPFYEKRANKSGYYKIGNNYDFIDSTQMEWYEWLINGITEANNGKMVDSTMVFHIPLMEFYYGYKEWAISGFDSSIGQGVMNEPCECSYKNNGLFDLAKSLGSTKNIICGHDHINTYSVKYQGITLTYGLKTGDDAYYDPSLNGGTTITYTDEGSVVEYHFVIE